eukprot:COSAG03_NODE_27810_length_251_cov_0.671053_1_plen_38_part_10
MRSSTAESVDRLGWWVTVAGATPPPTAAMINGTLAHSL